VTASPAASGATRGPGRLLLAAGLAHLALAVASLPLPEWGDGALFQLWAGQVAETGIGTAYATHAAPELRYDWPPLYLYLSKAIGLVYRAAGWRERFGPTGPVLSLLLKLPMIGLNLLVGWLLFRLATRLEAERSLARSVAAAWLWNPAIALATDVFGYQDALHTALLVATASALVAGTTPWAAAGLALVALSKPQAWIFLVPFGAYFLRTRDGAACARGAALAVLVLLLVLSPFLAAGQLAEVARAHLAMPGLHPWPSALAHNLWWLIYPASDEASFPSDRSPALLGLSPRGLALVMVTACAAWVTARLVRQPSPQRLVSLSALLAFAFFMLATQVHENHLYAMFPLLALGAAGSRFLRGVLLGTTLTFAANVALALHWLAAGPGLAPAFLYASLANAILNAGILAAWTRRALLEPDSVRA
jgi:Gpi18-like mannosyltransferase